MITIFDGTLWPPIMARVPATKYAWRTVRNLSTTGTIISIAIVLAGLPDNTKGWSEPMAIDDLLRRTINLNLRYYASVGMLTADYLRDLAEVVAASSADMRPFSQRHSPRAAHPEPPPPPAAHAGPMMVFEAEAGQAAIGVFLVENHLPHEVRATVAVSKMTDPSGNPLDLPFTFDPPFVSLKSREQVFIRATVLITDMQRPDVSYTGQISIPELGASSVSILVRRRLPPKPV
jgi:hypothetical protein